MQLPPSFRGLMNLWKFKFIEFYDVIKLLNILTNTRIYHVFNFILAGIQVLTDKNEKHNVSLSPSCLDLKNVIFVILFNLLIRPQQFHIRHIESVKVITILNWKIQNKIDI